MWFGGGKLAADLTLPKLRQRWEPGRAAPGDLFTPAERSRIWEHAARAAADAAGQIRDLAAADPAAAADAAWAAAGTLHAAASALGSRVIRQAADSFDRAARAPYGRLPHPTPAGNSLRRAARLLSAAAFLSGDTALAQIAFLARLAALIEAIADLREAQRHAAQAAAARQAAEHLRAAMPGYVTPPSRRRTRVKPPPLSAAESVPAPTWHIPARNRPAGQGRRSAGSPASSQPKSIAPTEPDAVTGLGGSAEVEGSALHGSGESSPRRGSEHELRTLGVLGVADSAAVVSQHGDFDALATVAAAVAALAPGGVNSGGPLLFCHFPDQVLGDSPGERLGPQHVEGFGDLRDGRWPLCGLPFVGRFQNRRYPGRSRSWR